MPTGSPFDTLRARFGDRPDLVIVESEDAFVVKARTSDGYDVRFESDIDGCNVGFDGWVALFGTGDAEEALALFDDGVNGRVRVLVVSRGGVDHAWKAERFEDGHWRSLSWTRRVFFPFWRQRTMRWLRNIAVGT